MTRDDKHSKAPEFEFRRLGVGSFLDVKMQYLLLVKNPPCELETILSLDSYRWSLF